MNMEQKLLVIQKDKIGMTNREKFKEIFNLYITEVWAKPEKEFLEWANSNYKEVSSSFKQFKCDRCGHEYLTEVKPQWDENYCFTY